MSTFDPRLRTDILDPLLLIEPESIKIIAQTSFNAIISDTNPARQNTPGSAVDIIGVAEIIQKSIEDYETRHKITEDGKINILYNSPTVEMEVEAIAITFLDRHPGLFERGKPGDKGILNRRPVLKELIDDPDNPGYKRAILGLWYDNTIKFTCWARTNKQANKRAIWFEDLMEEYSWFHHFSGINKIMFQRWAPEEKINVSNNIFYGRPLEYYVRTEKIWNVSQKILEQIIIHNTVATIRTT